MTKLNTTKIGDSFESKSLNIIKNVIEEEQLGHLADHIKIFQKKEYYSILRKKNIIFDLTIEVWPPGSTRYVLLYVIECKDYEKRVPVSKIEDFHSKILQVAGVNVKGIFISNSPLQEGGFNIAESTGMMVIQGESSKDYKIIMHKKSQIAFPEKIPIIDETIDVNLVDKDTEYVERLIDKKILNAFQIISQDSRISYNIDRLSKADIESIANGELDKIDPKIIKDAHLLSCKKIIDFIKNEFAVDIKYFLDEPKNLGYCDIKNNVIGINKLLNGTNRELFIIAHEFGHYTLHQKLSIGQSLYDLFEDSEYNFTTNKHDLKNPKHWIEWQANYFSSIMILPKDPFLFRLWKCQDQFNRPKGKIYIDDQYDNINCFNAIVKKLAYQFSVSKSSVVYRLSDMNLIKNGSRLKSIGQIISDCNEELFL